MFMAFDEKGRIGSLARSMAEHHFPCNHNDRVSKQPKPEPLVAVHVLEFRYEIKHIRSGEGGYDNHGPKTTLFPLPYDDMTPGVGKVKVGDSEVLCTAK